MAYSAVWSEAAPLGSAAANTIDDIFRTFKRDMRERLADILLLPSASEASFAVDPLRAYGLKLTDSADAKILLGDNAGTPRSLLFRNKADTTTYHAFSSTGYITTSVAQANIDLVKTAVTANTLRLFTDGTDSGLYDVTNARYILRHTIASGLVTLSAGLTVGATLTVVPGQGIKFSGEDAGIFVSSGITSILIGDYAVFSKGITVNYTTGAVSFTHGITATTANLTSAASNSAIRQDRAWLWTDTGLSSGVIRGGIYVNSSSNLFLAVGPGLTTAVTIAGTLATTFAGQVNADASLAVSTANSRHIVLNGSPTSGTQIKLGESSVFGSVGTLFSGGDSYIATNASQTNLPTDSTWTQSLVGFKSLLLNLNYTNGLQLFQANSGVAPALFNTFWGSPIFSVGTNGNINTTGQATFSAGATNGLVEIGNTAAANWTAVRFNRNGTLAYVGLDAANQIISGSSDNDISIRTIPGKRILFSVDDGTTIHAQISSTAITGAGNIIAGATFQLAWTGRSGMKAPADGVVTLLNNAETNFTRLQFGGTTIGFPAIRRNGAGLDFVTADEALYTNIRVSFVVVAPSGSPATTGAIRLLNNNSIAWRNAANSADFTLKLSASNVFVFDSSVTATAINLTTHVAIGGIPATAGEVRLPNATQISFRNSGNTANFNFGFNALNTFFATAPLTLGNTSYKLGEGPTSVSTSATTICAIGVGTYCVVLVIGDEGGTAVFADIVALLGDATGTPRVLSSASNLVGAATARTYTYTAGNLQLAMASGTYSVRATPIQMS